MKIVPEAERMDARVPLALLATALVILALSAILTLAVRSAGRPPAPLGGLSRRPPAGTPARSVGTAPVQAAGLFEARGAAPSTRQLPPALGEYGWVDRERGIVRIPLARAKQLYLRELAREPLEGERPFIVPVTEREKP